MPTTTYLQSRKALCAVLFSGCAFLASASSGLAAVINYTWTGGDGTWETRANWSPDPGASAIGSTAATRYDRVTISGNVTVTRTGNVEFYNLGADGEKAGTFDIITLNNGARLTIDGNLRLHSASGSPNTVTRNAYVGSNSILTVTGALSTGLTNSSTIDSAWTIAGEVNAGSFRGYKTTNTGTAESFDGGYRLNVTGGKLTVADTFDWRYAGSATNPYSVGQINISNGGIVNVGTFLANWTESAANVISFVDGTGSLTFGKTNYATQGVVQSLIDGGHIRLDAGLSDVEFAIADLGGQWRVTVVSSIPEPASAALLVAGMAAACAVSTRRRAHR